MIKRGAFVVLTFLLILSAAFIVAEDLTDEEKIQEAYNCLEDRINGTCEDLNLEQQIFSLFALGECEAEVLNDSQDQECWPSRICNIKQTAQATIALSELGYDTAASEQWLLNQNTTPTDFNWYLQIDSDEATSCTIFSAGNSEKVSLNEDKTFDNEKDLAGCLSYSENNYWLSISENCYDEEFEITCDQDFWTSLWFNEDSSSTMNILEGTNMAAADETTTEKINSFCFGDGACNYEASLWATYALSYLDHDVSSYLPYIVTKLSDDGNEEYLPQAFLYLLGQDDYLALLLDEQKTAGYWEASGNQYYGTALALMPLYYEELDAKANAKEWLLSNQGSDYCWSGIRDTAFLLYSVWPEYGPAKSSTSSSTSSADCEASGYYCMHAINCGGNILDEYSCGLGYACCNEPEELETCGEQLGEICKYACIGGEEVDASDTSYGEICCVSGVCSEYEEDESECEEKGGTCRSSCFSSESEVYYDCDSYSDSCCISSNEPSPEPTGGKAWIWILATLIALVVLGIIFRDKLKELLLRFKSGKGPNSKPSKRGPPRSPPGIRPMVPPRRILPPSQIRTNSPRSPLPRRKSPEVDDVLKKLKEMSR